MQLESLDSIHFCLHDYSLTLKPAARAFFRLFNRSMPLIIAALLIAAQTLGVLHSVAHAGINTKTFASDSGRTFVAGTTSDLVETQQTGDAQSKFWTVLFGHSADSGENATACSTWDAAFAAASNVDSGTHLADIIVYRDAAPPFTPPLPALTDLLGLSLARAPPRA